MPNPQKWPNCDSDLFEYVQGFVALLRENLNNNLVGVYLHGSLSMDSYYPPKSDIDILAVTKEHLSLYTAERISIKMAHYSDRRPTIGNIEFSLITKETAAAIPNPIPYELHYSSAWHDRILNRKVDYISPRFDSDLFAHLQCIKCRGLRLYGEPIETVFGDVNWHDFMYAILDDLRWVLEGENILESPYYCVLNACRVVQLLVENVRYIFSKEEGGVWGLSFFPERFIPVIQMALAVYRSNDFINETERKTGNVKWNRRDLLGFRDYVKELVKPYVE